MCPQGQLILAEHDCKPGTAAAKIAWSWHKLPRRRRRPAADDDHALFRMGNLPRSLDRLSRYETILWRPWAWSIFWPRLLGYNYLTLQFCNLFQFRD
jgi:hypothetical protein